MQKDKHIQGLSESHPCVKGSNIIKAYYIINKIIIQGLSELCQFDG